MIIDSKTVLKFHPKDKRVDDETKTHTALYDIQVDGESTGVVECVVSRGRDVSTTLEVGNQRFSQYELEDALRAAGHDVVTVV